MKLLEIAQSPAQNAKCKAEVDPKYPEGKACGATASWYLRAAGVFKPGEDYPLAANVVPRGNLRVGLSCINNITKITPLPQRAIQVTPPPARRVVVEAKIRGSS